MNISTQAYVYGIMFILTLVINFISSGVLFGGYGFLMMIISYLIGIPFTLLWLYNIDCLTNGNCNIWSWIITISSCISLILFTIFFILAGTLKKEDSNIQNIKTEEKKENFIY